MGDRIVDAHMHLWDLGRLRYPWLTPPLTTDGINGDVSSIAQTYLLDDYLHDTGLRDAEAGTGGTSVAKIVHVEAGANPADALAETRWLQGLANSRGYPQALVAYARLDDPGAEALLEQHVAHPNVRGIRQIMNWHPDPKKTYTPQDLIADPTWEKGFALLSKLKLSFDLQIYPGQMPAAARLASRHPDTQLVLNHTGMPVDKDAAGLEAWRNGMRALAREPNIAVKISGLAMLDWHWTLDSLRPFVSETIEMFGPGRCMFGSNFPVDRRFGSFERHYDAYRQLISGYSATERTQMLAGNAERIYRI